MLRPHGLNQGGFTGISEQECIAAHFKGAKASLFKGPCATQCHFLSPNTGLCLGNTENRLDSPKNTWLYLWMHCCSLAPCQCRVAIHEPSKSGQSLCSTWFLSIYYAHHCQVTMNYRGRCSLFAGRVFSRLRNQISLASQGQLGRCCSHAFLSWMDNC